VSPAAGVHNIILCSTGNRGAETGDIAGSLKLKRKEAMERFSEIIRAVYDK
jgi:hypothetical protein